MAKRRHKLFQAITGTPIEGAKITLTLTLEQFQALFDCAAAGAMAKAARITDDSDTNHFRFLDFQAWRRSFDNMNEWAKAHLYAERNKTP